MLHKFHLQTSRDGDKHADHADDLDALDALAFILEAIRAGCSINADDAIGALDFLNPFPDGNASPEWTHARLDLAPVADGAHEREQKRAEALYALGVLALEAILNDEEGGDIYSALGTPATDLGLLEWIEDDSGDYENGGYYALAPLAASPSPCPANGDDCDGCPDCDTTGAHGTPDDPTFPTSKPTAQA